MFQIVKNVFRRRIHFKSFHAHNFSIRKTNPAYYRLNISIEMHNSWNIYRKFYQNNLIENPILFHSTIKCSHLNICLRLFGINCAWNCILTWEYFLMKYIVIFIGYLKFVSNRSSTNQLTRVYPKMPICIQRGNG